MADRPTPAELGFRMPAEWEPHAATWIAWPHRKADWPGKFMPIPWVYADIVRALHGRERVRILVNDADHEANARKCLTRTGVDLGRVDFYRVPTDRVWTRDSGPSVLVNGRGDRALVDWHFNGWAKYPDWHNDDRVPEAVGRALGLPSWQPAVDGRRVVLEGGSFDVNGAGLMLTTEECLLSDVQARNPHMGRDDLERVVGDYLGVRKVLWLGRGVAGDDTHGHVDDLARFVGPRTVVVVEEADRNDENYEPLKENVGRLRSMTDPDGRPLEVVTLPMPRRVEFDGQRLPASYANFYVANGVVLVPTFNDAADRHALNSLAELFPGREAVGVHALDLVWGLGTLHCMTQQEPAG